MELLKVTKSGALHFRLSDGRIGVSYESGYVRVNTKSKNMYHGRKTMYQINKMIKVLEPNKWNANNYNYKRILVPTQYDRVNMLINFNNNNCI
tara:strand:- start:234 stop:512 length:279 start_codon:yes stop_codon:yes gene_type:complete